MSEQHQMDITPPIQKLGNNSPIESGLDVVLTLLYVPGATEKVCEPINGITRLQKLLFLLWKEGNVSEAVPNLYNFSAYDFGPCVDDLYDDLEFAEEVNLIKVEEVPSGNDYEEADEDAFLKDFGFRPSNRGVRRDFSLTEDGCEAAKAIFEGLGKQQQEAFCTIKRRYNFMPFFDLLRYVYRKYPKFAEKSILGSL